MNKRHMLIIGIVAIVLVAGFLFYGVSTEWSFISNEGDSLARAWQPITITQDNVADVLSRTTYVNDLPDEGKINLYVGETGYTLQKGTVTLGVSDESDLTISIPESYLDVMGEKGPCAAVQAAKANNDLGLELAGESSTTSLAWKYRALAKYRSCLG